MLCQSAESGWHRSPAAWGWSWWSQAGTVVLSDSEGVRNKMSWCCLYLRVSVQMSEEGVCISCKHCSYIFVVEDDVSNVQIMCAWCQKVGIKRYSLSMGSEVKCFCSEKCFAACRRAYFKRNKVREIRKDVTYIDMALIRPSLSLI